MSNDNDISSIVNPIALYAKHRPTVFGDKRLEKRGFNYTKR
ncbi:MAG: hypothetical protein AAFY54_04050 [Cyanobacteria bacterium J06648_10]